MLRLAELRLLATRWQLGGIHLEGKGLGEPDDQEKNGQKRATGHVDVVLGYRNARRMERLVKRAGPRLRIVDGVSAFYRLQPNELEPLALYTCLKHLLRLPERTV